MIRAYQALKNTWFEKGKQKIIPTYGKQQGIKLMGALNYETGEVFCIEKKSYNAQDFLYFLEKTLEKYPTGKIVMILDNARIHHAKLLKNFLKESSARLKLVFLPPYSPDLNLIEGLWKWLKEKVVYNVFYSSIQEIKNNVHCFLSTINNNLKEVIDRLCCKL